MARQLTQEEIAAFHEDGVVCVRGALSQKEVDGLRDAVDAQVLNLGGSPTAYDFEAMAGQLWSQSNPVQAGPASLLEVDDLVSAILTDPEARPLLEKDESSEKGLFLYDSGGWREHAGIRKVAFDSVLPEMAATLLKSPTINFWQDTTFVKAPHTRQRTAFHQDIGFTQIDRAQAIVPWIPLDAANKANGVTRYVRGSHDWGETYAANMLVTQTPTPGSDSERCPDIEANEEAFDIISFDVEPGDVIFHHILTIHGSGGNTTDKMRRAISFRYCGEQVRYYERPGALPQAGLSDQLRDGDPLHSKDYPIVYPKPWPNLPLSEIYQLTNFRGSGELEGDANANPLRTNLQNLLRQSRP